MSVILNFGLLLTTAWAVTIPEENRVLGEDTPATDDDHHLTFLPNSESDDGSSYVPQQSSEGGFRFDIKPSIESPIIDDEETDPGFDLFKVEPSDESPCPAVNLRAVNTDQKPKYELNPKLYLTPVYIWGPSSQLQGLREAIGVAIRLNRTLVLPPFLTHQSDPKGGDKPIPVDIRLDVPELRKLLTIAFTDEVPCAHSDVVFLARGIYNKPTDPAVMTERVKRIEAFEKSTSMIILRRNEDGEIDEARPFLERSIPVTRSPKVSGAGVQLSEYGVNNLRRKKSQNRKNKQTN
jgi:hypothetical protein